MRAADVVTKFLIYIEGQTLHKNLNGRSYTELMFDYGQFVLRNISAKVQGGQWAHDGNETRDLLSDL